MFDTNVSERSQMREFVLNISFPYAYHHRKNTLKG